MTHAQRRRSLMKRPKGKANRRLVTKLFGFNDYGFSELPQKTGTWVQRWIAAHDIAVDCPLCYMIGNADNKHPVKRNWKRYRKTQWKLIR